MKGKYDIKLKKDAVPVIHAPRRIPIAMKEPLRRTLDDMVKQTIIKPVEEPTDWVNIIVIV